MATRLLADKGIREFAEASGRLKARYGDQVDFQIAGAIDSNPTAIKKSEIDCWEEQGWIRYRGLISNMPDFLSACSVFVLPSWYMEGTPRSILEAMSTGRAIITTDNRGCKETVDHEVNGLIVPQQDAIALEHAMEKLIIEPELLVRMGQESRKLAESKYEIKIVCRQMMDALEIT
jgi:glycosyltransferase involved in cell wall biosynthesis